MTMLSFRVDAAEAERLQASADARGIDRSELLRNALHRELARLAAEDEVAIWADRPLDEGERSLEAVADWGPAEDWSDWADAEG